MWTLCFPFFWHFISASPSEKCLKFVTVLQVPVTVLFLPKFLSVLEKSCWSARIKCWNCIQLQLYSIATLPSSKDSGWQEDGILAWVPLSFFVCAPSIPFLHNWQHEICCFPSVKEWEELELGEGFNSVLLMYYLVVGFFLTGILCAFSQNSYHLPVKWPL